MTSVWGQLPKTYVSGNAENTISLEGMSGTLPL